MSAARQFCERIGIDHPIVLAPMGGGPSTPELVAAVSCAGGLGTIAAGYLSASALEDAVARTRRLTAKPIAINLFVPSPTTDGGLPNEVESILQDVSRDLDVDLSPPTPPDPKTFEDQIDVAFATDARLISLTFGIASGSVMARLRQSDKIVAATANTIAQAQQALEAGCDVVILQGFEAGGHRGGSESRSENHVGLVSLLEHARRVISRPVVASGGVASGAGVAACLALGAAAVQIGTAFLVADESGATPEWKRAVLESSDTDTTITAALTGRNARGVRNRLVERLGAHEASVPDYPIQNSYTTPLRRRAKELGQADYQSLWAGQSGGTSRPGPASEIMARLVSELADVAQGWGGP